MKKIIKKIGRNIVINLTGEELEAYDLDLGDIIDVEICKLEDSETKRRGQ